MIHNLEDKSRKELLEICRIQQEDLDKSYNDLANFEGYPEEVSALRHDIERRKQRYQNILHNRMEWKQRAEAAEKRLAEVERERDELETDLTAISIATGRHETWRKGQELQNKRDIEQQIKGVEDAIKYSDDNANFVDAAGLEDYLGSQLRQQLRKDQDDEK